MTAPLPNLQQRFEAVLTPALAVDGLRQQGGGHGEGDAALQVGAQRRSAIDPWLVGQTQTLRAFEDLVLGKGRG